MHQKELRVVRFSMIVLFSALMIVYLLLYQIKGDDIVDQLSTVKSVDYEELGTGELGIDELGADSLYEEDVSLTGFDEANLLLEETQPTTVESGVNTVKKSDSLFNDGIKAITGETNTTITVLSGTSLWYGRVESVEKLGISYQYALRDQKDIYYVFLDPSKYKFDEIVKSLGGTMYTITTEKEMVENKLFGDKVTFINLPEYKEKKVIMLIEIEKKLWLIQVDYTVYHKSKGYIKQLFIQ